MGKALHLVLAFVVLAAPGCSTYEALSNYADTQEELARAEAVEAQAQTAAAAWKVKAEEYAAALNLAENALANSPSPADQAYLEAETRRLAYMLDESESALAESQGRLTEAQVATARAEGREALAKEMIDKQGQVVEEGAALLGGAPAAGTVRIGILALASAAAAVGRARSLKG